MTTASRNKLSDHFLLATLLGSLLLGACSVATPQQPAASQVTPTSAAQGAAPQESLKADACLAGIIPGQSTREDAIAALGEPESAETSQETGDEILAFPATDQAFPISVLLREGVVALIGVSVDEQTLSLTEVLATYGEPESTTFSNFMMHAMTYLYPTAGVAFVVLPDSDIVLYQQCVQPMTLDEYMASWGTELPLENPYTY